MSSSLVKGLRYLRAEVLRLQLTFCLSSSMNLSSFSRKTKTKAEGGNHGQVKIQNHSNENESQPNHQTWKSNTFAAGLAQEEVCCEILMIRSWDRQLQTCRQHNSNSNKTSCYHKAHYSKDNFWVLGATFDMFNVHFKQF